MNNYDLSIEQAEHLLSALSAYGDKGRGIISLAVETGISQSNIRQFFYANKEFCIPVKGRTVFKINMHGPHNGSVQVMVYALKEKRRREAGLDSSGLDSFFWF